jgi:uncharacterized damage-inducible protein DinB
MAVIAKPAADEFLAYYAQYIDLVPESDLARVLQQQIDATRAIFGTVDEAKAGYRYAPGKWSVREVLGHLTDGERIFTYRLLCVARGDVTPLPGFDEQAYVPTSGADRRTLASLLNEFVAVRGATIALVDGLSPEAWTRRGSANGHEITPRALAYIVAGHERHHMETLRTRYGVGMRE